MSSPLRHYRHRRPFKAAIIVLGGCLWSLGLPALAGENFAPDGHPRVQALIDELAARGLPRDWLVATLSRAEFRQQVLDAMAGAAERPVVPPAEGVRRRAGHRKRAAAPRRLYRCRTVHGHLLAARL